MPQFDNKSRVFPPIIFLVFATIFAVSCAREYQDFFRYEVVNNSSSTISKIEVKFFEKEVEIKNSVAGGFTSMGYWMTDSFFSSPFEVHWTIEDNPEQTLQATLPADFSVRRYSRLNIVFDEEAQATVSFSARR